MRSLLRGLALAVALAAVCAPSSAAPSAAAASSAAPSAAELERARKLFAEAQREQGAQHWQEALDKLTTVASIKDTAGIRFHIGNCLEHQGKLVEALEAFQRAHAMAEDSRTRDVLQTVGTRIEQLRIRIPTLTIRLPEGDSQATVHVDGRELDRTLIGTPVGLNPGTHSIVIEFSRAAPIVRELELYEGRPETLEFLRPAPRPVRSAPVATSPPAPREAPKHHVPVGAWITMGSGVALAAGGFIAFVSAGRLADDSREACARSVACDPDRATTVRSYDAWAVGLWSAGAVALGAGLVWDLLPPKTKESPQLSVSARPSGLDLQGAF